METQIYDPVIKAGIEANTHFDQEILISCKPQKELTSLPKIKSSYDAFIYIREFFRPFIYHHEEVWMILLSSSKQIIGLSQIAKGGIDCSIVDIRIIYQIALLAHATSFILVHNHPTALLKPSRQDEDVTRKIVNASHILKIDILDHLIISEYDYFSFADKKMIL